MALLVRDGQRGIYDRHVISPRILGSNKKVGGQCGEGLRRHQRGTTDMGGPHAHLSIEESIPKLAQALAAQQGTPGLRYYNYLGETVAW